MRPKHMSIAEEQKKALALKHQYDSLKEFHLDYPDYRAYEIVDQLISILDRLNDDNQDDIANEIKHLLDDAAAAHVLKLFSEFKNVDHHFSTPKMLLHILFFHKCYQSIPYVAYKLNIDSHEAQDLLDRFKRTFTIDDPLVWLQNFKIQTEKLRKHDDQQKAAQLHGRETVIQETDTAEKRKTDERKNKLRLRLRNYLQYLFKV